MRLLIARLRSHRAQLPASTLASGAAMSRDELLRGCLSLLYAQDGASAPPTRLLPASHPPAARLSHARCARRWPTLRRAVASPKGTWCFSSGCSPQGCANATSSAAPPSFAATSVASARRRHPQPPPPQLLPPAPPPLPQSGPADPRPLARPPPPLWAWVLAAARYGQWRRCVSCCTHCDSSSAHRRRRRPR